MTDSAGRAPAMSDEASECGEEGGVARSSSDVSELLEFLHASCQLSRADEAPDAVDWTQLAAAPVAHRSNRN
jgi:hypothetical protein